MFKKKLDILMKRSKFILTSEFFILYVCVEIMHDEQQSNLIQRIHLLDCYNIMLRVIIEGPFFDFNNNTSGKL